jgi:hypothetical protein
MRRMGEEEVEKETVAIASGFAVAQLKQGAQQTRYCSRDGLVRNSNSRVHSVFSEHR